MKTNKIIIALLGILFLSLSFLSSNAQQAKYVFYFIGDGMGLAHVAAAEAYLANSQGKPGFEKMSFSKFPVSGFATTYAANRFITGSAAAGTALATGHKTSINSIAMDSAKLEPLQTIAEKAKLNGFKVGIISSVSIDHATPASFYAHQPQRGMYHAIALDLPKSGFDFFGGGSFHSPIAEDGTSAFDVAQQNGYTITDSKKAFRKLKKGDEKVYATGNVVEGSGALRYAIDQTDDELHLEEFVAKGIELLDNEKGFFMMCEEGKIDWASHENDAVTVIHNVISLSRSVETALEFYHQHPDETLIVVTSDHETGGLVLGSSLMRYSSRFEILQAQHVSAQTFTQIADSLFQIKINQNLGFAMQLVEDYFGLGDSSGIELSEYELDLLEEAYLVSTGEIELNKEEHSLRYGGYFPLAAAAIRLLNNKAGLSWSTWSHTGIPVPVFAIGAGSETFDGYYDNTDIPKKIAKAMGIEWSTK
jgi:alkaline phosphatase